MMHPRYRELTEKLLPIFNRVNKEWGEKKSAWWVIGRTFKIWRWLNEGINIHKKIDDNDSP